MKTLYTLALLTALTSAGQLQAQRFVNGDLEANSACETVMYNHYFNRFMLDAGYGFGNIVTGTSYYGKIYLFTNTGCSEGPAQKGDFFLGLLSYTSGWVDAMSLKLDAPLHANKTYTLTFYTKKSKSVSPVKYAIPLEIGYTTDSLKFGTLVTTIQAPTSTNWALQTVHIRPTVATRFITIRAVKATLNGTFPSYTMVDNFSIAVGTAVSPEKTAFSVAPHPNPFKENLRFNLGPAAKMPCIATLTDMTGRVVQTRQISGHDVQISRNGMSAGVYQLRVQDASGAQAFSRIIAE